MNLYHYEFNELSNTDDSTIKTKLDINWLEKSGEASKTIFFNLIGVLFLTKLDTKRKHQKLGSIRKLRLEVALRL